MVKTYRLLFRRRKKRCVIVILICFRIENSLFEKKQPGSASCVPQLMKESKRKKKKSRAEKTCVSRQIRRAESFISCFLTLQASYSLKTSANIKKQKLLRCEIPFSLRRERARDGQKSIPLLLTLKRK